MSDPDRTGEEGVVRTAAQRASGRRRGRGGEASSSAAPAFSRAAPLESVLLLGDAALAGAAPEGWPRRYLRSLEEVGEALQVEVSRRARRLSATLLARALEVLEADEALLSGDDPDASWERLVRAGREAVDALFALDRLARGVRVVEGLAPGMGRLMRRALLPAERAAHSVALPPPALDELGERAARIAAAERHEAITSAGSLLDAGMEESLCPFRPILEDAAIDAALAEAAPWARRAHDRRCAHCRERGAA